MAETARLGAGAMDHQRPVLQRRLHEIRQDHAIAPGLARPGGVEEPQHNHRQSAVTGIGQRHEFIKLFGRGIGPAQVLGGTDHQIIVFVKGKLGRLAINFGGRGDEGQLFAGDRRVQHVFGAADIGQDRAAGLLHDELDPNRCRKMKHHIGGVHMLLHQIAVQHGTLDELQLVGVLHGGKVAQPPGGQIIECGDGMAIPYQTFGQMRPDEPGTAGNQYMHIPSPKCPQRRFMGRCLASDGGCDYLSVAKQFLRGWIVAIVPRGVERMQFGARC